MASITVSVLIDAPVEEVWRRVTDIASHSRWMSDAESIEFVGEATRGIGTRMIVVTRVGPLRTRDLLEVTEWTENESIGVVHDGLVKGTGRFALTPADGASMFTWSEELRFPWWLGGPITTAAARPILERIWRRNLTNLRRLVESGGAHE